MLGLTPHGGNRVLVQIANEFVRRGHTCRILTPRPTERFPFWLDPRVEIVSVGPTLTWKPLRWLAFLLAIPGRSRAADCLVVSHFLTALPARLMERFWRHSVVYIVQDIEYRFFRRPTRWLAQALCRWTWGARFVIPANEYLALELQRLGAAPQPPLQLGVDPFFLEPRAMAGRPQFDVVCLLRRERHKRSDRLLALADLLVGRGVSVLCICQDRELWNAHQHRFSALARPGSDAELRDAFDSARLLVLTSDHEGFALPPLECMARGLPSVLFPCGGAEVYARDDHNCVIVRDESIDTAARAIIALLADSARYARLSQHAQETARRYDMSVAARDFVDRCSNWAGGTLAG
ncbi:MAG TPA: glycosyltransferase family 4 protein [Albitalea sp.]